MPRSLSAELVDKRYSMPNSGEVTYDCEEEEGVVSLGRVSGLATGAPWALDLILKNNGSEAWPANTALTCCFGDGFGCERVLIDCEVAGGEHVCLHVDMQAPIEASRSAWVMTSGEGYFGPLLMLE